MQDNHCTCTCVVMHIHQKLGELGTYNAILHLQIDLEGSTSPLRHVPGRSSHSVSAGETTSTDNNDQVTFGKEIMEKVN